MSDDHNSLRILYGVSSDGNGHIARAGALIPELENRGAHITTLFSGSTALKNVDEGVFSDVIHRKGYARSVDDAQVNMFKTVAQNIMALPRLARDVMTMDLRPYDIVITDFEPISAWSTRFQNLLSGSHKPSIGIANQYSFEKNVPKVPSLLMDNAQNLARAKTRLGMHFHHFGQDGILPPFVGELSGGEPVEGKVLVYLGFDELDDIKDFLQSEVDYDFHVYSKHVNEKEILGNLTLNPIEKEGFRRDFYDCEGVITGAGFMTSSEALHLGKKLLLRPLAGHPEQASNVLALQELDAAHVMDGLDKKVLRRFLVDDGSTQIKYPDVTRSLADWIMNGDYSKDSKDDLCQSLWNQADISFNHS